MGLSERQINAVKYVKEKGRINNLDYQKLNSISRQSATRDLSELTGKLIFKQTGKVGQGTYYSLKTN